MFVTLEVVRLAGQANFFNTDEQNSFRESRRVSWASYALRRLLGRHYEAWAASALRRLSNLTCWSEAPEEVVLAEQSAEQSILAVLRGIHGVRLKNCGENIGKAKFSFNRLQVRALPKELRPPLYVIGGGKA